MRLLTKEAVIVCDHGGKVQVVPSQLTVFIANSPVLVEGDTLLKAIAGCPNVGPTIKPCTLTLSVESGQSSLIRINGRPVMTDEAGGGTDGTPPMATKYKVLKSGQDIVSQDG